MSKLRCVIPFVWLALCNTAQAETSTEDRCALTLAGASYHADRSSHWREDNPGIGIECQSAVGGYYRNSYDKDTWYVGAAWRPLSLGRARIGVIGALATGYDLPVVVMPTVELRITDRVLIDVIGAPAIGKRTAFIAAQLKLEFQ